MNYHSKISRCWQAILYGIVCLSASINLEAQNELPDSSDWNQLWDTFWASDDLLDVWPILDDLEEQYAAAARLEQFVDPAIGLLREAYEYGFFPGSRSRLLRLGEAMSDISSSGPEPAGQLYFELARSYFFTGQHDSLRHFLDRSLSFYPAESPQTWNHYNLSGVSYLFIDNRTAAIEELLTARGKLLRLTNPQASSLVSIESNLAQVYQEMGDLSKSLHYRILSLQSAERSGEATTDDLSLAYGGLVIIYDELGQYDKALEYSERAVELLSAADRPDVDQLANLYLNTGVAHKNLGAYDQAEANYWQAESIYRNSEEANANLALVYTNLANLATFRADYEQAIDLHLRSREYYQAENDASGISETHTNIGIVHTKAGDWEQALDNFIAALDINRQLGNSNSAWSNEYLNLSDAYRHLGELDAARAYADSALQLINTDSLQTPERIYAYLSLARIEVAADNPASAKDQIDRCLAANLPNQTRIHPDQPPAASDYLRYDYLFESLILRASLLKDDFPSAELADDRAYSHLVTAQELLSSHGSNLISQEDRIQLARFRQQLAEVGLSYSFERWETDEDPGWIEAAFQFAEFAKAGVLREVLLGREARDYVGIPPQLQQREDSLRAVLALQRRQMLAGDALVSNSATAILSTEQALANVMAIYEQDYPDYAELISEEPPVRLSAIQYALEPGQVLQYYFSSSDRIYGFMISKQAVETWQTPINTPRFKRDITAMRKGITRQLDRVYRAKAWSLYQQLFPAPFPAGTEKVVLALDGALLSLPFEALLTQASTADMANHELPYLLKEMALSYTPSANMFYTSSAVTRQARQESWDGLIGFAPVFQNQSGFQSAPPLPATEREMAQLDSIFARSSKPVSIFTHEAANEAEVYTSRLGQARFIHFATHGFVDTRNPELSGVLLYPGQDSDQHDGQLTAGEIFHLRISAELVVLSACETGRGRLASGEGLLGLSRSFLHAGAEHLIVSLWPVQDGATAQLMVELYSKILAPDSKSLATQLRAAKLQLMGQERWAHPFYWSPFVLIGG